MTITSLEMYALAQRAELRNRVEVLALIIAGEIFGEDISLLGGGLDEHNSRFALALKALDPTDELAHSATKGVAVAIRDLVTLPDEDFVGESMDSRMSRLAVSIPDDLILTAMRNSWTSASGFDLNAHTYIP